MSYLVLARKYRPKNFEQVVKQDHVTITLTNAIRQGRMHHAILFSGPRGTGKTTVARILAKAMNCKKGPTPVPCDSCRSCMEIASGNAADVFEIDGASNNSVDQVRELRGNIKYMPSHSLYKIYIIDEVHMLSLAAFNALLKTLEEPPSHVMFIFATTEPHKIPATITSRCQRHDFKRIDMQAITEHLKMLCSREGIDADAHTLGLIARESGGSMRDALSLLDQVAAFAEGPVEHDQVSEILGVVDRKILFDISDALLDGETIKLLDIVDEVYNKGYDMKRLYADLVEHFRNMLVAGMGKKIDKLINLPSHEIDLICKKVQGMSTAYLNQIFELLFQKEPVVRHSERPRLAVEMIFIRILQIKPALPIDSLIEKLDFLRKNIDKLRLARQGDTPSKDCGSTIVQKTPLALKEKVVQAAEQTKQEEEKITEQDNLTVFDLNAAPGISWKKIFDFISAKHPSLAANLVNSRLKKITEKSFEIEINGTEYNIKTVLLDKNIDIIKKVCKDLYGKKCNLVINSKTDKKDKAQKKNQADLLKQEALSHPLVSDAIDIFNGEVVEVKLV